jgi:hypothetical protein
MAYKEIGNWSVDARCDWLEWLSPRGFNWLNFCLVRADFEWDRAMGDIEVELGLLGFRVRVTYLYDRETKMRQEVRAMVDAWEEGALKTVSIEELRAERATRDKTEE